MNKKVKILAGVALASLFVIKLRLSHANGIRFDRIKSIRLVGDSQTKRHLAKSFAEVFPDKEVTSFGKEGSSHRTYVENKELMTKATEVCADLFVVQLGDNGVPKNDALIEEFINNIKRKCPKAQIVWGGPMIAVRPSIKSNYVNTTDSSSPRFIDTYNSTRKIWNERLKRKLSSMNIPYLDHFNSQLISNDPRVNKSRGGDGVHLSKDGANAVAEQFRLFLENHYANS